MDVDAGRAVAGRDDLGPSPLRELRDSLVLLGLVVSSLGVYLGLGALAVRLLGGP